MTLPEIPPVIIGALIAGCIGIFVSWLGHQFEIKRKQRAEEENVRRFLISILCEIETVWAVYMKSIGDILDQYDESNTDEYIRHFWSAEQNNFPIFDNTCQMIGQIKDEHLRRQIIMSYTAAKTIIETGKLYNIELRALIEMQRDGLNNWADGKDEILKTKQNNVIINSQIFKETHIAAKDIIDNKETGVIALLKTAIA
jgi:hypothetical protein